MILYETKKHGNSGQTLSIAQDSLYGGSPNYTFDKWRMGVDSFKVPSATAIASFLQNSKSFSGVMEMKWRWDTSNEWSVVRRKMRLEIWDEDVGKEVCNSVSYRASHES